MPPQEPLRHQFHLLDQQRRAVGRQQASRSAARGLHRRERIERIAIERVGARRVGARCDELIEILA
jgi:hypothetical protein